jgi:hypothetical protein
VAHNSTEAKYMETNIASYEAIWIQNSLVILFDHGLDPMIIYCDNHSCIKLFENPIFHDT